jgi:translation elongation factor EF-G
MYGKRNFPMMGVEIRIHNGIYTKSTFSKSILNRTTTELLRKLINSSSIMLEPMMEFSLSGEEAMIDIALKDVLSKRGSIDEQAERTITGKIPASEVRGWIKELRAMGLEVEMKFSDYEEVVGVDPNKLVERN